MEEEFYIHLPIMDVGKDLLISVFDSLFTESRQLLKCMNLNPVSVSVVSRATKGFAR